MYEKETTELYKKIQEEAVRNEGPWQHSPVEGWKVDHFPKYLDEFTLANFRRIPFADGMISFPDRPLRRKGFLDKPWVGGIPSWHKVRGVRDIFVTLKRLRSVIRFNLSEVSDNLIGNPCYYRIGKYRITDFAIRMCFYKKYIENNFSGINNVLEVGGGFGGICLSLLSSKKLDVRNYTFVELPEILPLAYWFLRNSNLKVTTIVTEEDLGPMEDPEEGKTVLLVAPWMLPKMNLKFDLFVNTMSFQHMDKKNLDYYLSEIDRLGIPNLFLVEGTIRYEPGEVNFDSYPMPGKYKLFKEDKYPFSDHSVRIYKLNQ